LSFAPRIRITLAALFGLAALTAQTADLEAQRRQAFEAGEAAMHRSQWAEAEKQFLKIVALAPGDVGAHANLGVIYMRQQKWKRALEELHAAEKLAPQIPGIRLDIGLVYYRAGEYHKAIAPFESVLRDQPDSGQARHLLGLCYTFDERYADATAVLEPLWPTSNSDLSYLYVLAVAAGNADRHDLEDRALARLMEVGQNSPALHLMMGKAYLNRGDDDQALAELEKAAEADPKLPMVHYNIGIIYKRKRDLDKAKAEFLKDIAVEPDVAYNYDELGTMCLISEQNIEARRYFEQALHRNSQIGTSWYGLAKIDKSEKHYTAALKALDSAGAIDPKSPSVHYLRAQVLTQLGRKAEAQTEFAAVRRLQSETAGKLERDISGTKYRDPQLPVDQKLDQKVEQK
jgi:tetratricopeptide (TPR) repeat protein